MKKLILFLLLPALLLTGCKEAQEPEKTQYTATFLDLFDTVTTVVGYGETKEEFEEIANNIQKELKQYHELLDIYHTYDGISNLATVNENAGIAPVKVAERLLDFLEECKTYYALTNGRVNVTMGSVLALWHDARSQGISDPMHAKLPAMAQLEKAKAHMDPDSLVIDREASTVYLSDPESCLDVGAIAKGWAVQQVAHNAPEGLLISVGGNVVATGPKPQEQSWVIGIQDPDGGANLHTIYLREGAVVTSGDYQRTYTVDGQKYHHIIDPDTCMPGGDFRSVTVVCSDSSVADALSTALFLLPLEQGKALAESQNAEVFWLTKDGTEHMTDGFAAILRT